MGKFHQDRDSAVAHIQECIRQYGPEAGPKVAQARYAHIHRSVFWRWLKGVQADPKVQAAAVINRAMEITPADVMPAAPSPAIVARSPVQARKNLDFMGKLERLYADGEMLRDHSVMLAPDGSEKIKNPMTFGTSVRLRSDLLERWIQASQMLYDWQQMTGFYDAIVAEIAKLDPETSARIMERLADLNREKGFTV